MEIRIGTEKINSTSDTEDECGDRGVVNHFGLSKNI